MRRVDFFLVFVTLLIPLLAGIHPVNAFENSWELKKSMPYPQAYAEASVLGGNIFVFGSSPFNYIAGSNGKYYCNCSTQIYDPKTDAWTVKASMPYSAKGFAVASYKSKIYVFGGAPPAATTGALSVNRVYDPAADTWQTKSPMPMNLSYICANVISDKIYIIGGLLGELEYGHPKASDATFIYDPTADTWSQGTPIPTGVFRYASAIIDDKIYIIGGIPTNSSPAASPSGQHFNQIYTPETDTWAFAADPPSPFTFGTAAATTGTMAPKRIYLLGGGVGYEIGGSGAAKYANLVYNPDTDSWSNGVDLPEARAALAVAVVDDKLYAIGGTTGEIDSPLPLVVETDTRSASSTNAVYLPIGYGTPDPTYQSPSPSTSSSPSVSPLLSSDPSPTPTTSPNQSTMLYMAAGLAITAGVVTAVVVVVRKREK
jgi:N-acetylneuraminic acid mutarotase